MAASRLRAYVVDSGSLGKAASTLQGATLIGWYNHRYIVGYLWLDYRASRDDSGDPEAMLLEDGRHRPMVLWWKTLSAGSAVLCYFYMVDGQGTSPRAILGLVPRLKILLNGIVRQNVCSKTYGSIMYRWCHLVRVSRSRLLIARMGSLYINHP